MGNEEQQLKVMNEEKREYRFIGTRPVRPDGVDKVTGRANFGADLHLADMIHGCVVRSPHAHARIKSIKVDKALAVPGVKAVITGADFPQFTPADKVVGVVTLSWYDLSRNVIARDKALYDGPRGRRRRRNLPRHRPTGGRADRSRLRRVAPRHDRA